MSSKSRPQAKTPAKAPAKTSTISKVASVASMGASMLGIGGSAKSKGGHRRKHKKTAQFYAREIARLKLKKRYEKVKLGLYR